MKKRNTKSFKIKSNLKSFCMTQLKKIKILLILCLQKKKFLFQTIPFFFFTFLNWKQIAFNNFIYAQPARRRRVHLIRYIYLYDDEQKNFYSKWKFCSFMRITISFSCLFLYYYINMYNIHCVQCKTLSYKSYDDTNTEKRVYETEKRHKYLL